MAERILIVIHDDWELKGNGAGNVARLQYLPALFLMDLAERHNAKLTFTAEVGQQLAFLRHTAEDPGLAVQARLWEETIGLMLARGFDVQLHIHPHWFRARFEGGAFRLDRDWNLATYPEEERAGILRKSVAYLREVKERAGGDTGVTVFKAGSYGMQPWPGMLAGLREAGIQLVLGVQKGLRIDHPDFQADYTQLEEPVLPYYPDAEDVCRVGTPETGLVVLPVTHYTVGLGGKAARLARRLSPTRWLRKPEDGLDVFAAAPETPSPLAPSKAQRLAQAVGAAHARLDLGSGQAFIEWKCALDAMMRKLLAHPAEAVPLVIESHSKNFAGNTRALRRFFTYLFETYGTHIETETLGGMARRIAAGELPIRSAGVPPASGSAGVPPASGKEGTRP